VGRDDGGRLKKGEWGFKKKEDGKKDRSKVPGPNDAKAKDRWRKPEAQ